MKPETLKRDVIAYARSLGFERVGVTSAEPLAQQEAFLASWLKKGHAGEMHYLKKEPQRRTRPGELLPGARSVIALAMNYYIPDSSSPAATGRGSMDSPPGQLAWGEPYGQPLHPEGVRAPVTAGNDAREGRIARYAWGADYHKVIGKRLDAFVRYIEALAPDAACKTFVDTGPLLERPLAQQAGLGFIGKNTMLITRGLGSWVFLAHVITSLELPLDAPDERSCGECRLCIEACPTEAITAPYELDPRRCIAYLTIELESGIDEELREKTGEWVFGCDVCQDVCPHNTPNRHSPRSLAGNPLQLDPRQGHSGVTTLAEILSIADEEEFRARFAGTALLRAERHGLIRNACLAAAHLKRNDLIPQLEQLSRQDPHPVVRDQAAWALQRLR